MVKLGFKEQVMAKYIQQEYLDGDSFYPLPKEFNENIESIIRKVIILGAYRNDWKIILREGQENQKIKEGIATLHEKIIVWFDLSEKSFVVTGFFISHVSKADEIEMLLEDAVFYIHSEFEKRKKEKGLSLKEEMIGDLKMPYGKESPQGFQPLKPKKWVMSNDFSQETAEKAFDLAFQYYREFVKGNHSIGFADLFLKAQEIYDFLRGTHTIWERTDK